LTWIMKRYFRYISESQDNVYCLVEPRLCFEGSMTDQTIRDLVQKAQAGTITDEEVAWAADMLRQGGGGYNRYDLLEIIGSGFGTQYEALVASFLNWSEDSWMNRLALQILCNRWGLSAKYVEEIRRFMASAPRDVNDDVRLVAISQAGEHLRAHQDDDLLRRLWEVAHGRGPRREVTEADIEVFGVEGAADLAAFTQSQEAEVAIEALERALGDNYPEIFSRRQSLTKAEWQAEVLRRVEEKFGPLT
jgi:hypothetical protein